MYDLKKVIAKLEQLNPGKIRSVSYLTHEIESQDTKIVKEVDSFIETCI